MSAPKSLKVDEYEYVRKDSIVVTQKDPKYGYFPVGKQIVIRTVTMMVVGTLEDVTEADFVLSKASWIADSGRFSDFINGTGQPNDVEPFNPSKMVFVNRGSYVDMTEISGDFSKQK
jgi:hypothetical protein